MQQAVFSVVAFPLIYRDTIVNLSENRIDKGSYFLDKIFSWKPKWKLSCVSAHMNFPI